MDWTKLTAEETDVPSFIRRLEKMKAGGTTDCPFCGGTVGVIVSEKGRTEIGCGSCDMRIWLEAN